jgi:hypothetical protein
MDRFHLISVRPSDKTKDKVYYHNHDLLWGVMEKWLREGGAIPDNPTLDVELHFAYSARTRAPVPEPPGHRFREDLGARSDALGHRFR